MKKQVFSAAILMAVQFAGYAQDGVLDATFGTAGTVITNYQSGRDIGRDIAVQSDGKIVVGGAVEDTANQDNFAVFRYNPDGSPDNTFGTGGRFVKDFNGHSDVGRSMAIQSDGKILLTGYAAPGALGEQFTTIRLNTDGTMDASFGTAGVVTHQIGTSRSVPNSIVVQPDGKILVGGMYKDASDFLVLALARYNSNGSLDNTFGSSGIVMTSVFGEDEAINSIAVQGDGKIVATGRTYDPIQDYDQGFIMRFNADGTVDNSFGTSGKVIFGGNFDDEGNAIKVAGNGMILVGGMQEGGSPFSEDLYLTRRNSDGSADTTFGTNGEVIFDATTGMDNFALDIWLQSDGKILAGGYNGTGSGDILLVRFDASGALDNAFGSSGVVSNDIMNMDAIFALALQNDGKIVVTGTSNEDVLVQRYSNTVSGIETSKSQLSGNLFPNPVHNKATLTFDVPINGDLTIEVYNSLGASVKTWNYSGLSNINQLELDFGFLNNGNYIIRTTTGKSSGHFSLTKE